MTLGPGERRRCRKWAMVGHKGGRCAVCGERVTEANFEQFDFDHRVKVEDGHDKADRWGGGIRDVPPFSDRWFAWAKRVDLVCRECHMKRHRNGGQLTLEFWEVQARLAAYEPQPFAATVKQLNLFGSSGRK